MSKLGIIGFFFIVATFFLLCYQLISAALALGPSDDFNYENIRFVDVFDAKYLNWIDSIQSVYVQSVAEFLISAPLLLWLLGSALIFFTIQAFKRVK